MSDFYEKLQALSLEWADADAEAATAEYARKLAYSRAFLIAKGSNTVEAAKNIAEVDDKHQAAILEEIKAKHRARVAREAKHNAELSFERWRTKEANHRAATRAAT